MIQVKYKCIQQGFMQAIDALSRSRQLDIRTTHKVAMVKKKAKAAAEEAQELYVALVKKYAKLDEKGEVLPISPEQPGTFAIREEAMPEWKAEVEAFHNITFQVPYNFKLEELAKAGLSADELLLLEPVLQQFEVIEGGDEGAKANA